MICNRHEGGEFAAALLKWKLRVYGGHIDEGHWSQWLEGGFGETARG